MVRMGGRSRLVVRILLLKPWFANHRPTQKNEKHSKETLGSFEEWGCGVQVCVWQVWCVGSGGKCGGRGRVRKGWGGKVAVGYEGTEKGVGREKVCGAKPACCWKAREGKGSFSPV